MAGKAGKARSNANYALYRPDSFWNKISVSYVPFPALTADLSAETAVARS